MNIFRDDDYVSKVDLVEVLQKQTDPMSIYQARQQGARSLILMMYRMNMESARGAKFRFTGIPSEWDRQKAHAVAREIEGMPMDLLPEVMQGVGQICGDSFFVEICQYAKEN